MSRNSWRRVNRAHPCPKCEKPDNCSVSEDGTMVWCGRISEGSIRENAGGQFLHRLRDDRQFYPPIHRPIPKPQTKPTEPKRDWKGLADQFASNAGAARAELATLLGVPSLSLEALGVGWNAVARFWSFPERDGDGQVIGINSRYPNGQKKRIAGSKSGLTFATTWDVGNGPIFLVEGGSDTAALHSIGLAVVGRPSNRAGVSHLTDLLYEISSQRSIIVVGERDRKPDGTWPGRDGAISTAQQLAENLHRPVAWTLPPDGAKDARGWLQAAPKLLPDALAKLWTSGMDCTVIQPPVVIERTPQVQKTTSLPTWRQQMLEARLRSLETPGIYLDRSTTGAGKSRVDLQVILKILRRGAAA